VELHTLNIFHGDIKPENIFVNELKNYATTDIGSALDLTGEPDSDGRYEVKCFTEIYAS
jgi:serine/threonine protein kinase